MAMVDPAFQEEKVLALLKELGIAFEYFNHAPAFTVADSETLSLDIPGLHMKSLFLRDKKRRFFLLSVEASLKIDLKHLRHLLSASGNLSFGDATYLADLLGVLPGSVNPLAVMNDTQGLVSMFLDKKALDLEKVNIHPMRNDRTVVIKSDDLRRFLAHHNHGPGVINFQPEIPVLEMAG